MVSMADLRVVIADDSVLHRSGVAHVLGANGIEIVAEAKDFGGLLDAVDFHRPDVAIMDVPLPPAETDDSVQAALELRRHFPKTAVLVLSRSAGQEAAGELLQDPRGVGYLLKDHVTNAAYFIETVRRVAAGGNALDPTVLAQISFGDAPRTSELERLSPRELDVLGLMAEGLSNLAISQRLSVTERAVEKHIRSILPKLDLPAGEQLRHRRVLAVLKYLDATDT